MSEHKHWMADKTAYPQAAGHGWAIYYDPTPGGRDNGDGTKSYAMKFPALMLFDGLVDPEKVAHEIADKLNRAEQSAKPPEATVTEKLTRDAARQAYAESGLDYFPLTFERMSALRDAINSEMLAAGLMQGTYHMAHPSKIRIHGNNCAELRCVSFYFEDREAVTFNSDGFVGFAGWADETNVQPILRGFLQWVEHEAEVAEIN